jgi:uncharacterized protein YqiB (DUF1249 family)
MNTTVLLKRPPPVDLVEHLSVCEFNYHALLRMLPDICDGRGVWHFALGIQSDIQVTVNVLESSPYTSLIELTQSHEVLPLPRMRLRLYHDAEVAEVVAWDSHRHWQPQYEYPNQKMYQVDEKQALNRFMREWLSFCRKTGISLSLKCDSVLVEGKKDIPKPNNSVQT